MDKKLFYEMNPWWEEEYIEKTIPRNRYVEPLMAKIESRSINIIIGLRRVGKSTIMK